MSFAFHKHCASKEAAIAALLARPPGVPAIVTGVLCQWVETLPSTGSVVLAAEGHVYDGSAASDMHSRITISVRPSAPLAGVG